MATQGSEPSQRQVLLIEYEILDSFWTHQHQWIWLSGLVLITLSMLGITFLPIGFGASPDKLPIVTFVSVIAVILTLIWWGLLRQMLRSLRVVQHRKREIEKNLGMRMEIYMAASQLTGKDGLVRDLVQEEASEDPELRADLADFLRSAGVSLRPGLLPKEEVAWNLLPMFFIVTWIVFWMIVAGPEII
mgnify:FL=1|jgi:hypothetical protein